MSLGRPRGGFDAAASWATEAAEESAAAAAARACACAAVGEGPALLPPSPSPLPRTTRSAADGALPHSSRARDSDDETRLIVGRGGAALPAAATAAEGEGAPERGEAPEAEADGENSFPPFPPLTGVAVSEEEADAVVAAITLNPAVVVMAAIGEIASKLPLPALLMLVVLACWEAFDDDADEDGGSSGGGGWRWCAPAAATAASACAVAASEGDERGKCEAEEAAAAVGEEARQLPPPPLLPPLGVRGSPCPCPRHPRLPKLPPPLAAEPWLPPPRHGDVEKLFPGETSGEVASAARGGEELEGGKSAPPNEALYLAVAAACAAAAAAFARARSSAAAATAASPAACAASRAAAAATRAAAAGDIFSC